VGELLNGPVSLLPVLLVLVVIAVIGAGVIAWATRSTARHHPPQYESTEAGTPSVPPW